MRKTEAQMTKDETIAEATQKSRREERQTCQEEMEKSR